MKKNDQSFSDWNGEKLKKHRKDLNLSQIDMAKRLGLSERGYRCYETDKYRIPLSVKYAVLYWTDAKKAEKASKSIKEFDENAKTKRKLKRHFCGTNFHRIRSENNQFFGYISLKC